MANFEKFLAALDLISETAVNNADYARVVTGVIKSVDVSQGAGHYTVVINGANINAIGADGLSTHEIVYVL
jgi:hypothetical protein